MNKLTRPEWATEDKMAKPYPDRLASMFKPGARATDVVALVTETGVLIAASEAAEKAAKRKAIDPTTSDVEAIDARRAAEDHAFATERLTESKRRLEERLVELTESEQSKTQAAEYRRVADENAVLVEEIRETVPPIFAQLSDLFARIQTNDAAIQRANKIRPGGSPGIVSAEFVARGCGGAYWPPSNVNPVERLTAIKLPKFETWGYSWPVDERAKAAAEIEEQQRRQLLAYKRSRTPEALAEASAREEGRWARYRLRHSHGYMIVDIEHRRGAAGVSNGETFLEMTEQQAATAREKGIRVELAPLTETAA